MRLPDPPIESIVFPFGYENFDALVGRLKRSAIDAYVCGSGTFMVVGNHYENRMSTDRWLTCPDQYGMGDVVPLHDGEDWGDADDVATDLEVEIDRIRRKVDNLVDKWRNLPAPMRIQEEVDQWRRIFATFDSAATDGGQDPLVRNVGRLQDVVNGDAEHGIGAALEGGAADAFKEYVDNLYTTVAACRDVALVTGSVMAEQQGLWEGARQDFAGIVSNTADALDQIARQKPQANLEGVFAGAGIMLAAVGCFTAGASTVVAAGLSAGLTIVGPALADSESNEQVSTYSRALDFLDTLLNDGEVGLAGRIEREEMNIRKNITDNVDAINRNRSVFDPRPGPIESTGDIRRPDPSLTDTIYSLMSEIAGDLTWVGDRARGSAVSVGGVPARWMRGQHCLVERDHEIGIGRIGPTEDFQGLADLLGNLAFELSWEVSQGEKNLRAAMDLLDQANADARHRLSAAASDFAAGHHGDGL